MAETQRLKAGSEERGIRLDVFLTRRLPDLTRSQIQSLNRSGAVLIEGRREKAGYRLRGGEAVEVDLTPIQPRPLEAVELSLRVLFEDEDLAVVEKPAGLTVHPGAGTRSDTLVHGLLYHFQSLSQAGGEGRPGIVHRLDKFTSGLLVVARNDWAHSRLSRSFHDRAVEKTYLALVHGKPARPSGEISLRIGRDPRVRTRMRAHAQHGRTAYSSYRLLRQLPGFALLEVKIKTGRTHQIRVHLSAIGHPVVGDAVYGPEKHKTFVKKFGEPGRYLLHAAGLRFPHPRTGEWLQFESGLPADFEQILSRLG